MSSPSPSTISTARLSVSSSDSDITLLSIGQHVTSLAAGKLDPELDQDVLVVGTQTTDWHMMWSKTLSCSIRR